jgi:hypothetical protein
MPFTMQDDKITTHLIPVIGLQLTIARRAGSLRNFQFGPIRRIDGGTVGSFALHLQCPWRLEGPQGIVTGSSDLDEPADETAQVDWDTWDYDTDANLQDAKLAEVLQGYDPSTRSIVNHTSIFFVESGQADVSGGMVLSLTGGYRLVIFPAGSRGEHWRLFQPDSAQPHLVYENESVSLHS